MWYLRRNKDIYKHDNEQIKKYKKGCQYHLHEKEQSKEKFSINVCHKVALIDSGSAQLQARALTSTQFQEKVFLLPGFSPKTSSDKNYLNLKK